ncbi:preprotein translocase subunit SecG [Spirosoma utsteinense]|uniref:Protein-export membrane protein SecG n=1 Tax=Spirosoma utsteinense TaxID=2585773 RepID=A0ABR6W627_9BACT|nr:preprotein translocase subunit SecG [Spirosoma utsteinense]MBC3785872.1 preprotein translocase subunit SecG [Spirosoma utsteinense]MBC3792044.1 preprotein translocase subunit SecG [Spirosoma utsteinense]
MVTTIIVLICILTVLLILIVLIQNSKGGGLTGEFGGLGSNQLMGVKKTTDLLEQITWGLGVGIMVLSLVSYVLIDRSQATGINSANVDRAQTQTLPGAAAPAPAPTTTNGAAPSQAAPGAATPGASTSALTPQK